MRVEAGGEPGVGAMACTTRQVRAKRSTTTTSISTVTDSVAVVKVPCAPSSLTRAIAEDGERATARQAIRRAIETTLSCEALAVMSSQGDAMHSPKKTKV